MFSLSLSDLLVLLAVVSSSRRRRLHIVDVVTERNTHIIILAIKFVVCCVAGRCFKIAIVFSANSHPQHNNISRIVRIVFVLLSPPKRKWFVGVLMQIIKSQFIWVRFGVLFILVYSYVIYIVYIYIVIC